MYSFVFCRVFIILVDFRLHCVTSVMHQSTPALPIPPPGVSRAFAHVSIPGVGHLKLFYYCPGVGHLHTPGTTPGHLRPLSGFGLACNMYYMDFRATQDHHFRKNLLRSFLYGSCVFSSSVTYCIYKISISYLILKTNT